VIHPSGNGLGHHGSISNRGATDWMATARAAVAAADVAEWAFMLSLSVNEGQIKEAFAVRGIIVSPRCERDNLN
jgi:hypothetical protein